MPCETVLQGNWSADFVSWAQLCLQDNGATGQKTELNNEIALALFAVHNLQRCCPNSLSIRVNSEGLDITFIRASRLRMICFRKSAQLPQVLRTC